MPSVVPSIAGEIPTKRFTPTKPSASPAQPISSVVQTKAMTLQEHQQNILNIHNKGLSVPEPDVRLVARLELAQEALQLSSDCRGLVTRCVADIRQFQVEALGFRKCTANDAFQFITGTEVTDVATINGDKLGEFSINPITGKSLDVTVNVRRMWHMTFNTNKIPFERRVLHLLRTTPIALLRKELIPNEVWERLKKVHEHKLFDGYLVTLPESMIEKPTGQFDPVITGIISYTNKAGNIDWTSYFVDSW